MESTPGAGGGKYLRRLEGLGEEARGIREEVGVIKNKVQSLETWKERMNTFLLDMFAIRITENGLEEVGPAPDCGPLTRENNINGSSTATGTGGSVLGPASASSMEMRRNVGKRMREKSAQRGGGEAKTNKTASATNESANSVKLEQSATPLSSPPTNRRRNGIPPQVPQLPMPIPIRAETELSQHEEEEIRPRSSSACIPRNVTADPTPCSVCGAVDPETGNEMIYCNDCAVCVHQLCYGVRHAPVNGWKCSPCARGLSTHEIECHFCPVKGGALKPIMSKTAKEKGWGHVVCALWIPEVLFQSDRDMEPIVGLDKIPKARWDLKCSLCPKGDSKARKGACIQCQYSKRCAVAFHVTCAMKHGLEMKDVIDPDGEGTNLQAYCKRHTYVTEERKRKKKEGAGTKQKGTKKPKQSPFIFN